MPSRDSVEERIREASQQYLPNIDEIPDRDTHRYPALSSKHLALLAHGEDAVDDPAGRKDEIRTDKIPLLATRLRYLLEDLMLLRNADFMTSDDWAQIQSDIQELSKQNEAYAPALLPRAEDKRPTATFELAVQLAHLYQLISGGRETLDPDPDTPADEFANAVSATDYDITTTNLQQWNHRAQQDAIGGFLLGLSGRHIHVPDNPKYPDKHDVLKRDISTKFTSWRELTGEQWYENTPIVSTATQELMPAIESAINVGEVADSTAVKRTLDTEIDTDLTGPIEKDPIVDWVLEHSSLDSPVAGPDQVVLSTDNEDTGQSDVGIIKTQVEELRQNNVFTDVNTLTEYVMDDIEELYEHKLGSNNNPVRAFEVFHVVGKATSINKDKIKNKVSEKREYGGKGHTIARVRNNLSGQDNGKRWDNAPLITKSSDGYRTTNYGGLLAILLFPDANERQTDAYLPTPTGLGGAPYEPADTEFYEPTESEVRTGLMALRLEQPESERTETAARFTAAYNSLETAEQI